MANTNNITVLWASDELCHLHKLAVASATVIAAGDLISKESGLATVYSTLEDDETFMGVALTGSAAGETTPITVSSKCVIRGAITAAVATFGNTVAYAAGGNGTDYRFAESTTDTIGWNLTNTITPATTTSIDILIDVFMAAQGAGGTRMIQTSGN